jgi:hypothetical protein
MPPLIHLNIVIGVMDDGRNGVFLVRVNDADSQSHEDQAIVFVARV